MPRTAIASFLIVACGQDPALTSLEGIYEALSSVDIEVDEAGLVVTGNVIIAGLPRRYHARLTFAGDVADEWLGNANEFAGGLTLGLDGDVGRQTPRQARSSGDEFTIGWPPDRPAATPRRSARCRRV